MKITKISKAEIVSVGREAMSKVKENRQDILDNLTLSLGKIIGCCDNNGFKIQIPYYEFLDFLSILVQRIRECDCMVVVSIPSNPPLDILDYVRTITDNAIGGSITNVDRTLRGEAVIHVVGIKPDRRIEYAVDYATRLL